MERAFINDVGGKFKVPLKDDAGKRRAWLLWGDAVLLEGKTRRDEVRVRTGRWKGGGWVPKSALDDGEGLLELYAIDVGQGDGILIRTPDDKWHLVDAGTTNARQMTGKGAANFVRWKFLEDLGEAKVRLENVVLTHPDLDHYGGMVDLFSGELEGHDPFGVEVAHFWHSGMARFASGEKLGRTVAASVPDIPNPSYGVKPDGTFITELLGDLASFAKPRRPFEKSYAQLAAAVASAGKEAGRLSAARGFLPGYEPGKGDVAIRVLGPVAETVADTVGLRVLGGESVTRNGHSVVLRVEYGRASFLLTGDLNAESQRLLLSYEPSDAFTVDVAKGCHHGSDKVDFRFLKAMGARATVLSSGDNEDYAHPRPVVLGASGCYGRFARDLDGEEVPPLVYSTELARSLELTHASAVRPAPAKKGAGAPRKSEQALHVKDLEIKAKGADARFRSLAATPISGRLVYGLINVRTDGRRILCGYMMEAKNDFDIRVFQAGVV